MYAAALIRVLGIIGVDACGRELAPTAGEDIRTAVSFSVHMGSASPRASGATISGLGRGTG
jgi:hypothetical protein